MRKDNIVMANPFFWKSVAVLAATCALGAGLASVFKSPIHTHPVISTAGSLAAITAGAVIIERIIEIGWSLVDLSGRAHWPAGVSMPRLQAAIESQRSIVSDAREILGQAKDPARLETQIKSAKARLASLNSLVDAIRAFALNGFPGVSKALDDLQVSLRDVATALDVKTITDSLEAASVKLEVAASRLDAIASNPGRRLLSILIGVALGLLGAWLLGLDVYASVNASTEAKPMVLRNLWVAITGVAMGLGSTPTHELIGFLQKRKQAAGAVAPGKA